MYETDRLILRKAGFRDQELMCRNIWSHSEAAGYMQIPCRAIGCGKGFVLFGLHGIQDQLYQGISSVPLFGGERDHRAAVRQLQILADELQVRLQLTLF